MAVVLLPVHCLLLPLLGRPRCSQWRFACPYALLGKLQYIWWLRFRNTPLARTELRRSSEHPEVHRSRLLVEGPAGCARLDAAALRAPRVP